MTATLLQIVQRAADHLGLPRPASVVNATDGNTRRLLAMANEEGEELAEVGDWSELHRLATITTVDSQAEYAFPSDYARMVRETEWDEADSTPLLGPTSAQEWRLIKSGFLGSGVVGRRYRIMRSTSDTSNVVVIDPTPTSADAGEDLTFEYISKNWCQSSGGTAQALWAADDDTPLLPERLVRLGVVVRWKRSTGLEFGSELVEYNNVLSRALGRTRPAVTLSLSGRRGSGLIGTRNIPETGLTGI